jgi:peroxiredoxin
MNENDERHIDRVLAEYFQADDDWQPDLQRGIAILRDRHMAANVRSRRWTILVTATAAACILIAVFPVSRAFARQVVSACVRETVAVRAVLLGRASSLSASATYVKSGDRRMAPDFVLSDASGQSVRLADFRGKVVLLSFWATWCAPCDQEIPWFVEFQRMHNQRGFTVLGVSMDEGGWGSVKPYIETKKVNYPVMIGNSEVAGLFGGQYFPMPLTLIIDRSGQIAAIHAGLCRKDEYESDINTVLNER